jgi:hypothetical protein
MTLRELLAAEGGLIAGALGPGGAGENEALHVAAIREGQRLHAGAPRLVTQGDPDLALLAGDRLYALGLERLAAAGDLDAVAALAEVISHCAQALANGDPAGADSAWATLVRSRDGAVAGRVEPGA